MKRFVSVMSFLATFTPAACSVAEITATDAEATATAQYEAYLRADMIQTFDPSLVGGRVEPVWLSDGVRFYYEATAGADRGVFFLVDPRSGKKQALFDSGRIAAALSAVSDTPVKPGALAPGTFAENKWGMLFEIGEETYWCNLTTQECEPADTAQVMEARRKAGPDWVSRSPDGQWDAFIWNYNIYLRSVSLTRADPSAWQQEDLTVRQGCDVAAVSGPLPKAWDDALPEGSVALTHNGSAEWGFGLYRFGIETALVQAERYRLKSGDIVWSPDSKKFVVPRHDLRGVRQYPLYSSTSRLPVDHSYYYAAPGDTAVPRHDYYVFDVADRAGVRIDEDLQGLLGTNDNDGARWGSSSDELYVPHTSRGSKKVKLSRIDPDTGTSDVLVADSRPTFVEIRDWEVVNGGREVFWVSERDGWGHLYRFDETGDLKNRVTEGPWAVASIEYVDPVNKQIWFTAWGKESGVPYYAHLYRVGFDGSDLIHLTPEPGNHHIRFTPNGAYFLDTYSTISTPPVTVVRSADGRTVMELERGDVTALRATGWSPAEVFTVKARDGATDLWGIMHKPSTFDPTKKYPVIANVYPGPQQGSVSDWVFQGPDSFRGTRFRPPPGAMTYSSVDGKARSLAELGFIVIQLDAMGTARRSKAFQDYFYGRVRDNGLPDQIAAIRQLGDRHTWIDTTGVGVWGHSGGGYAAAAAMLHHPDFFKVGVAQSGNHDYRIYGWYWGEKYQGFYERTPTGDNYEEEANYKYAANLEGQLLIMSGDMDCNNPPAETLRLVDALIKAEKNFDMLLVPDAGHQLPPYATKRIWDYFVRHLQGEKPAENYRMIGH